MYSETQSSICIVMTNLERTKLIDKYLSREMTKEEQMDFERLLSEDKLSYNDKLNLRDEMELQQEIESAIQERGLREMLQKEEAKIIKKKRIKQITIWSLGSGSIITAIAAVMLLLFVSKPIVNHMRDLSSQYVSQWDVSGIRGDDEYEESLNNAIALMQEDKWDEAGAIIEEVYCKTRDEQGEYAKEIHEFAEWLKAIWLMHEGSESEAKDLLQKIAESDSYYSDQASDMLEKL